MLMFHQRPFSAGITFDSITAQSTDATGKPSVIVGAPIVHKVYFYLIIANPADVGHSKTFNILELWWKVYRIY